MQLLDTFSYFLLVLKFHSLNSFGYKQSIIMSKNSTIYILWWFLIQSLIEINCQTAPFKPLQRELHTATLIEDKLYILGGAANVADKIIGKQFFYLDVSVPFNTQYILWRDLTNINIVPSHFGAASIKGGANNNTLFLYGGLPQNNETMDLIYKFDTKTNSWNILKTIDDNDIVKKIALTGIVDYNQKMYLFGEFKDNDFNDMLILDTINLSWGKGSSVKAPIPRYHYGATFLPNQHILYLGK